jgi:hypothetical protein
MRGLLSGSINTSEEDSLGVALLPVAGGAAAASSIQPQPGQHTDRHLAGTRGRSLRSYASFGCISIAYAALIYMLTEMKRPDHPAERLHYSSFSDYPWSWVTIGLSSAGFVATSALQCRSNECRIGSKDGSEIKWSRIAGYISTVVIMFILISLPTFLYIVGAVQQCDTDPVIGHSKDDDAKQKCEAVSGCNYSVSGHHCHRAVAHLKPSPQAYGQILSSVFTVLAVFRAPMLPAVVMLLWAANSCGDGCLLRAVGTREIVTHWRSERYM